MGQLGLAKRPANLAQLQAVAAVGQSHLIEAYDRGLRKHGRHAAQLLLTAEDLDDRTRYLNVRNTLLALFEFGAIPIINENDTVSVEELKTTFGDNDRLAAMVTNLIRAPLLVLLSDVDGLFDGDPAEPASRVVPTVLRLDASITALVRDQVTGLSKGGMASKIEAARHRHLGRRKCDHCQRPHARHSGQNPGRRKRRHAVSGPGSVDPLVETLDRLHRPAARTADCSTPAPGERSKRQGRSLLAIGITGAAGEFQIGDVVALVDPAGSEFARGLTNYATADVARIKGLRTEQIAAALGHCPYVEVIHRDNMALTSQEPSRGAATSASSGKPPLGGAQPQA